ncbi:MAG: formylglycine-generating enzyme family protein [Acidobacteriota bacterium]|nr:formylglycine-generating enzyme family protein [Acidobacteriota bacterium]
MHSGLRILVLNALICLVFPGWIDSQPGQTPKSVLAVIQLQEGNGVTTSDAMIVTTGVEESVLRTNQYILVEKSQIKKILDEQKYQQLGTCELECAVQIGKQLAATKVVIGNLARLGDRYAIQLKLIDVESAQTVNIASLYKDCKIGDLPDFLGAVVNQLLGLRGEVGARAEDIGLVSPMATGQEWQDSVTGTKFVLIPAGVFDMGSNSGDPDEKPIHRVSVNGFWIGKYEVSVGQWRQFSTETGYKTEAEKSGGAYVLVGKEWKMNPGAYWDKPGFGQTDEHPVTCVSWNDTQHYIEWINKREDTDKYRLPTEAEWEYACRAGSTGSRYGDQGEIAWYWDNSGQSAHSVGKKKGNAFGLYDMLGNVWEWCLDLYGPYSSGFTSNPAGASSGSNRIFRGGSWAYYTQLLRSSDRGYEMPSCRYVNIGFRLVKTN